MKGGAKVTEESVWWVDSKTTWQMATSVRNCVERSQALVGLLGF